MQTVRRDGRRPHLEIQSKNWKNYKIRKINTKLTIGESIFCFESINLMFVFDFEHTIVASYNPYEQFGQSGKQYEFGWPVYMKYSERSQFKHFK